MLGRFLCKIIETLIKGSVVTIGELLDQQGAQYKIFDMGRRISEISVDDFAAFESMQTPYFSPYLKQAWLAIIAWHPRKPGQHNIWFLKLPLDERNLLQYADRDAFVAYCLRVLQYPEQEHGEAPCSYKPDPHRMAFFHALALQTLAQPSSKYYQAARDYLSGQQGFESWQALGLQGLAEVVSRLDEDENNALLAKAMMDIPSQPRSVLLGFLENIQVDQQLTNAINDALAAAVAQPIMAVELAAFARALSQSANVNQRRELLAALLQHQHRYTVELLAAIASRCWQDLHGELLLQYLECLARNEQGEGAFNAIVADLLTMPGVRHQFIQALASPQRSNELAQSFEKLLANISK